MVFPSRLLQARMFLFLSFQKKTTRPKLSLRLPPEGVGEGVPVGRQSAAGAEEVWHQPVPYLEPRHLPAFLEVLEVALEDVHGEEGGGEAVVALQDRLPRAMWRCRCAGLGRRGWQQMSMQNEGNFARCELEIDESRERSSMQKG